MKVIFSVILFMLFDNHGEIVIHFTDEQISVLAEILLPTVLKGVEIIKTDQRNEESKKVVCKTASEDEEQKRQ